MVLFHFDMNFNMVTDFIAMVEDFETEDEGCRWQAFATATFNLTSKV